MDDDKWDALQKVYQQLPEFQGWHDGIPYWFGVELGGIETLTSYLWVSVEPSGLLAEGQLEMLDWVRWQQEFQSLVPAAVGFAVKSAEDDAEWPFD